MLLQKWPAPARLDPIRQPTTTRSFVYAAPHPGRLEPRLYRCKTPPALGFVVGAMPGRLVLPASAPGLPRAHLGLRHQAALADDPELVRHPRHQPEPGYVPQVAPQNSPFARLREVGCSLALKPWTAVLCDQNG